MKFVRVSVDRFSIEFNVIFTVILAKANSNSKGEMPAESIVLVLVTTSRESMKKDYPP